MPLCRMHEPALKDQHLPFNCRRRLGRFFSFSSRSVLSHWSSITPKQVKKSGPSGSMRREPRMPHDSAAKRRPSLKPMYPLVSLRKPLAFAIASCTSGNYVKRASPRWKSVRESELDDLLAQLAAKICSSFPTCPGIVASREALRKGISSPLAAGVLAAEPLPAAAGEGFCVALLGVAAFAVAFGGLPPLRNPLLNPPKPPPPGFGVPFFLAA